MDWEDLIIALNDIHDLTPREKKLIKTTWFIAIQEEFKGWTRERMIQHLKESEPYKENLTDLAQIGKSAKERRRKIAKEQSKR